MSSVTCRFNKAEFPGQMTEIREWLDNRRRTLVDFEYCALTKDIMVVHLEFARPTDAYDFAQDFDGEVAVYA